MRQAESRHSHDRVHVRLEDRALVLLRRLVEGVAAKRETGVVEEDVEAAEALDRLGDEALATLDVGDVELELDLGLEPLDAAGAAGDADARIGELPGRRLADAARRAGDDRGLALESRHGAGLYRRVTLLRLARRVWRNGARRAGAMLVPRQGRRERPYRERYGRD